MKEINLKIQYWEIKIKKNTRTAQWVIIEDWIKIFEWEIWWGHWHTKKTYKKFQEHLEREWIIAKLLWDIYYCILCWR